MCPQVTGLVKANEANLTKGHFSHSYSRFSDSLSYRLYNTLRFGDITPSFVMEGVQSDQISLNSRDLIDSLSLKAPFKGSIRKIKESFMVPNMAILPRNWDRIYVQPSNGDDVPIDANCVLQNFPRIYSDFFGDIISLLNTNVVNSTSTTANLGFWLTALFRGLVVGEYVYSTGSLLNVSGYKASGTWRYKVGDNVIYFDEWFDTVISTVFKDISSFSVAIPNLGSKSFNGLSNDRIDYLPSLRSCLEYFRENPLCSVTGATITFSSGETVSSVCSAINTFVSNYFDTSKIAHTWPSTSYSPGDDETALSISSINLSRILAYQLTCHHFHSNSSVDFIYTAELYRQYCRYFIDVLYAYLGSPVYSLDFSWNGLKCPYDDLSGHLIGYSTIYANSTPLAAYSFNWTNLCAPYSSTHVPLLRLSLLAAIFSYRKSLRFADYFVGSRPRPLAPINSDVSVNSNLVSVVDITRKIQAQRFANSVMRTRSKIEEYVKGLFGSAPAPDYHNPFYLSREVEVIYGDEVQNTASSQVTDSNSRTANLASNVGRFTFTFHNDDMHPCIYLQLISFDIKRAYTHSVDRQFLHTDRFDMFNPAYQFIGDQPIYGIELGYFVTPSSTNYFPDNFAYTTRDMEYKQRFDVASGGFIHNLPGWALLDLDRSHPVMNNLNPDFIRSYNTELDQFFLSLTGFSLGSYFHFICITDNNVDAKRAMVVDPQILG